MDGGPERNRRRHGVSAPARPPSSCRRPAGYDVAADAAASGPATGQNAVGLRDLATAGQRREEDEKHDVTTRHDTTTWHHITQTSTGVARKSTMRRTVQWRRWGVKLSRGSYNDRKSFTLERRIPMLSFWSKMLLSVKMVPEDGIFLWKVCLNVSVDFQFRKCAERWRALSQQVCTVTMSNQCFNSVLNKNWRQ